jgi:hypothetical protein
MLFGRLFFSSGEVKEMACGCKAFGALALPAAVFALLTAAR